MFSPDGLKTFVSRTETRQLEARGTKSTCIVCGQHGRRAYNAHRHYNTLERNSNVPVPCETSIIAEQDAVIICDVTSYHSNRKAM